MSSSAEALASSDSRYRFGLYDLDSHDPSGGWRPMHLDDVLRHREQLVRQYNEGGGLELVGPFKSRNCCVALAGGQLAFGNVRLGRCLVEVPSIQSL